MFVNAQVRLVKTMIQPRHHDALRQVYMITYFYRTNNSVMKTYATIIPHTDISHSIIDTRKTLHNTSSS